MSKVHILRCLVNERLTAAAEEIFALFERTIAEYEEELCRSKDENQRKQQILDSVLSPPNTAQGTDVQIQTVTEEKIVPMVKQEDTGSCHFIKEQKPCINSEDHQIHELTFIPALDYDDTRPNVSCAPVKHEPYECSDSEGDWDPPAGSSDQRMEAENDSGSPKEGYNHDNDFDKASISKFKSFCADNSSLDGGGILIHHSVCLNRKKKPHGCSFCEKTFRSKRDLQRHMVTHTGEKPYSCPVCKKSFTQQGTVRLHMEMHTGEKRHSCPVCAKCFRQKQHLRNHMVTHTGEKPFHCAECNANFSVKRTLIRHMKSHIGEKVCFCPICDKGFTRHEHLKSHMLIHTTV